MNLPWRGKAGPGAEGYNNLTNAYYKQGRIDQAIDLAREAIASAPEYGEGGEPEAAGILSIPIVLMPLPHEASSSVWDYGATIIEAASICPRR